MKHYNQSMIDLILLRLKKKKFPRAPDRVLIQVKLNLVRFTSIVTRNKSESKREL